MRRLGFVCALIIAGCSESHTEDAGITFDATIPDAGPPIVCGNGRLETGEMCDDGDTTPGDGCDASCHREPYCGDGTMGSGEVCDDGDNQSGDGCRSDCLSDESCGNGIVDYAAGEICDGTANCDMSADPLVGCRRVTGCGDGTLTEPPEECEDPECAVGSSCTDQGCLLPCPTDGTLCAAGFTCRATFCSPDTAAADPVLAPGTCGAPVSWDGCDASCQSEVAMVVNSFALATDTGCDLTGDGTPDNAFARAIGLIASFLGPLLSAQIQMGNVIMLLGFQGLDDALGANDPDLRVAWMLGQDLDADSSAADNFSGSEEFAVDPSSLAGGTPITSIQSQLASSALTGGPEDIPLPFGFFDVQLRQGHIQGTTVADSGNLYQINDGLLCGGIPASLLALLSGIGGGMFNITYQTPCDGSTTEPNLLDVIIAGGTITATLPTGGTLPVTFRSQRPDLDLDGDGLEGFEVTSGAGCQAVVTACIDGNGTRIEGRNCFQNPAIGDGYSAAFQFSAIHAVLQPAPTP